jgi:hypothetical protein
MRRVLILAAVMATVGMGLMSAPRAEAVGWVHREFVGNAYYDMEWDAANGRWRSPDVVNRPFCLIGNGWLHPDGCEAALGWIAPTSGTVTIRGYIERPSIQGDGTKARIVLNGTRIWPSDAAQEVYPRFMVQHSVRTYVQAGDIIYFHVGQKDTMNNDTTLWSPTVTYGFPPKYLTDGAAFVIGPSDMDNVGIPLMDASLSTLGVPGQDGNTWFHSQSNHQVFSGPLAAPATTPIANVPDNQMFTGLTPDQGHVWFNNIYRHTDGSYLAFMHVEGAQRPGGSNDGMRVAIAHSTNPTGNWRYLGHIIIPFGDPSQYPPEGFNITGVPYFVKDGWFYIYFTDWPWRAAVARARVDDVMAAAALGTTTTWTKYCSGSWSCAGLGGSSDALNVPTFLLHSDAAWSSTRSTYILTGYNHGPERGVWMAFSQDGITWYSHSWLQRGTAGSCAQYQASCTLSPYVTIVAESGTDNSVVGDSFWVYWAFTPNWDDWPGPQPQPNYGLRWVARQRVTLTGY